MINQFLIVSIILFKPFAKLLMLDASAVNFRFTPSPLITLLSVTAPAKPKPNPNPNSNPDAKRSYTGSERL